MDSPEFCPHCQADLDGGSIWQTFYDRAREYGVNRDVNGKYCAEPRQVTDAEAEIEADESASMYGASRTEGRWGRAIGIYCMERDATTHWQCPDCGEQWNR